MSGLAGGRAHGALVTTEGQVWTWGDNQHGQLGDGASQRACTPLAVPGMTAVATVSTGAAHTLVTQVEGTVWAWGLNDEGQLGDGSADDRKTPAPVKNVCGVGRLNLQATPLTACPLTVEVDPRGDGQGTVSGGGDYAAGATITLTATPSAGSRFVGWGPEPCADQFTLPTPALALICRARFVRVEATTFPLTVATTGPGQGTVTGSGNYAAGTTVTLSAEPEFGSTFTGWSPLPCADQFLMPAQSLTCTATFESLPIVPLTVLQEGQGTISGGGQYQVGETVTLTATPKSDESHFIGWSPAPCAAVFTMPAEPLTCTATFTTGIPPKVLELVRHYYQIILKRESDPFGEEVWMHEMQRMQNLGVDLSEVFRVQVGQIFNSAEYRSKNTSDIQYVTDLYLTFFQREPDESELAYRTGQLAAGLPRDLVLYEFLFSPEYAVDLQDLFGENTSRPEILVVIDFYRGLLGRLPDDSGFRYWLEQFQTAQCQGVDAISAAVEAISRLFATSPEYHNRERTNSEYLQDLYNAFLRRGADVNGFTYWLNRLDSGDLTREQTRRAFVATSEFQGRVNQVIRQGCINSITTFTQVSAGGSHTCGITSAGAVECWGRDDEGQAARPTGVFTQVSAGNAHTCGVKSAGAVECWGMDAYGETLPPAGAFTQVIAGNGYSCGVRNAGAVECWGQNNKGQATPPIDETFIQISAGDEYACGLKNDGTITCWGDNEYGRATPAIGTFTQVSASLWHTCGVRSDGRIECWGDESYIQGIPSDRFTQVSAGDWHTCGLQLDGTIACWGGNGYGQATPPVGTFKQISAGSYHTCALKSDDTVACWGWNENGEATPSVGGDYYVPLEVVLTGSGGVTSQPEGIDCGVDCRKSYARHTVVTLTAISGDGSPFSHWSGACSGTASMCQVAMSDAQSVEAIFGNATGNSYLQVSAGYQHTCGVRSDGTVACWGNNYYDQAMPPPGTFTQVSAGWTHTCGVQNDGIVVCWGDNERGQATPPDGIFTQVINTCGLKSDGTVVCWGNNTPLAMPPAGIFTQISASGAHACAVRQDNFVVCWGNNHYGQATPPLGAFTQVGVGVWHTCGLKIDGTVECWGRSEEGQTTPPPGIFKQISTGVGFHICGVKSDSTVACWGDNLDGQANRPTGVFIQVSTGWTHTCGVKSDGAVVCWGDNTYGQSTPQ